MPGFLDPENLAAAGVIVVAAIIFAECGLLVGFFLPGDTLLFSAGLLMATGELDSNLLWVALVVVPLAAILGNIVGYWIGFKAGPHVFHRPQSKLFKPEYVTRAHTFFDRYGGLTIIVARFVPVMRTVATVMAGVSRMRFSTYLSYSVVGAILWVDGVIGAAYGLGQIKFVQDHVAPHVDVILVGAVLLSVFPIILHYLIARRAEKKANTTAPAAQTAQTAPSTQTAEPQITEPTV